MILPGVYDNLLLCAGDIFDFPMNWKDGDGNLFDLTGWVGQLTFVRSPNSASAIYQITESSGITFGSTSPNIHCVIPETDTTLDSTPYYYFLVVGSDMDNLQRLLNGSVSYRQAIPAVP